MNDLAGKTRRSLGYIYGSSLIGRPVRFVASILMARLLFPEDFGLLAMASALAGLVQILGSLGIPACVIQDDGEIPGVPSAAFWVNLGVHCLLAVTQALAAPFAAAFFREPRVMPLLLWLALSYPLNALGGIHQAVLRKNLTFGPVAAADVVRDLVTSVARVGAAMAGLGALSFILGDLLGYAARLPVLWSRARFVPRVSEITRAAVRRVAWFGGHSLSGSIASYLAREGDKIAIGRLLPAGPVGLYSFGHSQAQVPYAYLLIPQNSLVLSLFSEAAGRGAELGRRFRHVVRAHSFLMSPVYLFLAASAPLLIPAVFGERWLPSVPFFQLFAVLQLLFSWTVSSNDLLLALGRPDLRARLSMGELVLVAVVIGGFFVHQDIWWLAVSLSVARAGRTLFQTWVAIGLVDGPGFGQWLREALLPAACATPALAAFLVPLPEGLPLLLVLGVQGLLFSSLYAIVVLTFVRRPAFEALAQLFGRQRLGRWPVVRTWFRRELETHP